MRKSVEERFWSKVKKGEGCWEWQRSLSNAGYGQLMMPDHRPQTAHRLSWIFAYGEIPDGLFVCHHCDNRKCVRPEHLFLGTQKDNMSDAARKGRVKGPGLAGEAHGNSKLTDETVREIRTRHADGETQMEIAKSIGVRQATISRIILRQSWAHVK